MLTYDDVPRAFNLASYFVDRNVEEGRGARTALIGPGGATTYAELATLTNRSGNVLAELGVRAEERVLLVLADSAEFVALVRDAEDRRRDGGGVHVPPAEGLCLLPGLHARERRGRRCDDARAGARSSDLEPVAASGARRRRG